MNRSRLNTAGWFHRLADAFRFNEHTILLIIASLIGFIGGYGAVLFRWAILFFESLAIGPSQNVLESVRVLAWYHKLLLPVIGGMVVGPLVHFLGRETKGHGVPEVMEAVAFRGGKIRARVMFLKTLVSAVTIATGGSVGREGPIVQIGSGMGSAFGQLLGISQERMQVLVACGAAAGIAASFNAPMAGVLFSVEIILGNYAITTLVPLIMSSVMATIVGRWYFGDVPAFIIPRYSMGNAWEIAPYILLGIGAGFLAVGFARVLYAVEDAADRVPLAGWMKTPLFMVFIGLMVLFFPQVYGVGYDTITQVLKGEMVWTMLLILIPVKMLATSVTLGAGGSGGIFAPSLFLGSVFGGLFGTLGQMIIPSVMVTPGAYAVVGMSAVVAGTTHAPITAFLVIFEMTGDYKLILPLMLCSILASFVASRLSLDSIYTLKLSRRGVDLSKGMEVAVMQATKVKDVLHQDIVTLPEGADFSEVLQKVLHANESSYYVVDGAGRFQGSLSVHDVKEFLNEKSLSGLVVARDLVSSLSPSIPMDASLADCMRKFGMFQTEELPVVENTATNKLMGSVSRRDIINVYNREILRQGPLGMKFIQSRLAEKSPVSSYVNMPEGFEINVIQVSAGMARCTLKELDIRNNYGVSVISINRRGEGGQREVIIPQPDNVLKSKDMLVVIGRGPDIQNLKAAFDLPA